MKLGDAVSYLDAEEGGASGKKSWAFKAEFGKVKVALGSDNLSAPAAVLGWNPMNPREQEPSAKLTDVRFLAARNVCSFNCCFLATATPVPLPTT